MYATGKMFEAMYEAFRRSRRGAAGLGLLAFELLHEQIRHNLAVAKVIGWSTDWYKDAQVQEDFIRTSLERVQYLFTTCYLDLLRPETVWTLSGTDDQVRKGHTFRTPSRAV